MVEEIKKIVDRVEHLLNEYPATRDNDRLLWLAYLAVFSGLKDKIGPKAFGILKETVVKEVPMESLRRYRQMLQAEGLYVGKNRKARMKEEGKMRDWAVGKE